MCQLPRLAVEHVDGGAEALELFEPLVSLLARSVAVSCASCRCRLRLGKLCLTVRHAALDQPADQFGSAVVGDINGDGHSDLVVGAVAEDLAAGRVTILFGSRSGYQADGSVAYSQSGVGVPGAKVPGQFSVPRW